VQPADAQLRSVEFLGGLLRGCLQALIVLQISQLKGLDIPLLKRSILHSIPTQFSHPVIFQHNFNLVDMATTQLKAISNVLNQGEVIEPVIRGGDLGV
jgi:hypothetical protein